MYQVERVDGSKTPIDIEFMKHKITTHTKTQWLLITTVATIWAGTLSTHAAWQFESLPGLDLPSRESGSAYSILINPFSLSDGPPGAFVGFNPNYPEAVPFPGSVLRLDPPAASSVEWQPTVVDGALLSVNRLGYEAISRCLYAAGSWKTSATSAGVWQVRLSSDGGVSWDRTDDSFQLHASGTAYPMGLATDPVGNVYVSGVAHTKLNSQSHWLVRRKSPGLNGQWSTVADFEVKGKGYAKSMGFVPAFGSIPSGLIAVGSLGDKWTVQRSRNQGATWTTVDSWSPKFGGATYAVGIASDSSGKMFVVGSQGDTGTIRISSNGGDTWEPDLNYPASPGFRPSDIAADSNGNVWVAGGTYMAGAWRWTVQQRNVLGIWSSQAPFGSTAEAPWSFARGIAADGAGNVFVAGDCNDPQEVVGPLAVQRLVR